MSQKFQSRFLSPAVGGANTIASPGDGFSCSLPKAFRVSAKASSVLVGGKSALNQTAIAGISTSDMRADRQSPAYSLAHVCAPRQLPSLYGSEKEWCSSFRHDKSTSCPTRYSTYASTWSGFVLYISKMNPRSVFQGQEVQPFAPTDPKPPR